MMFLLTTITIFVMSFFQIMDFSQEEVAIFIAIVGVLSVISQVSRHLYLCMLGNFSC